MVIHPISPTMLIHTMAVLRPNLSEMGPERKQPNGVAIDAILAEIIPIIILFSPLFNCHIFSVFQCLFMYLFLDNPQCKKIKDSGKSKNANQWPIFYILRNKNLPNQEASSLLNL